MTNSISSFSIDSISYPNNISCEKPNVKIPLPYVHRLEKPLFNYQSYQELTRRLRPNELQTLEKGLEQVSEGEVKGLKQALKVGDLSVPLFKSDRLPYISLKAFLGGHIDEYQFGSLQFLWSIGQYHKGFDTMEMIPLFKEGKPNPETFSLIFPSSLCPSLSEEQIQNFFKEMKKRPLSEQQFFLVPDLQIKGDREKKTVSQVISEKFQVNVFNRAQNKRIIPSLSMMQTFLNVKYGIEAVKINPVLGLSKYQHMKDVTKRDMALHFPHVFLPEEADFLPAPWYDFSYHDFYHAIICSNIPVEYRKLMVRVADKAILLRKQRNYSLNSPQGETLRALMQHAIDMELSSYFQFKNDNIDKDPSHLFFLELNNLCIKLIYMPEFKNIDLDTVEDFYQLLAKDLILEENGASLSLTPSSIMSAMELLPPIPTFCSPLNLMHHVIKGTKRSVFYPGRKTEAKVLKLQVWVIFYLSKNSDSFLKASLSSEQIKKMQEELKENKTEVMQLIHAGFPIDSLLNLDLNQREKIFENKDSVMAYLLLGIKADQVIDLFNSNREKVLQASDFMIPLLEIEGTDVWAKVLQSPHLNLFLENDRWFGRVLALGASLDALNQIPVDFHKKMRPASLVNFENTRESELAAKWGNTPESHAELAKLIQQGFSFHELMNRDSKKLDTL